MFKPVILTVFAAASAAICSPADAGCSHRHWAPVRHVTQQVTYVQTAPIVPVINTTVVEKTVVVKTNALPEVHASATINIFGRFFGAEPGYVAMKVGKLDLAGKILAWSAAKVTVRIPDVEVDHPMKLTILVFNANGSVKKKVHVKLVNQLPDVQEIHVVEAIDESTLVAPPTQDLLIK